MYYSICWLILAWNSHEDKFWWVYRNIAKKSVFWLGFVLSKSLDCITFKVKSLVSIFYVFMCEFYYVWSDLNRRQFVSMSIIKFKWCNSLQKVLFKKF